MALQLRKLLSELDDNLQLYVHLFKLCHLLFLHNFL